MDDSKPTDIVNMMIDAGVRKLELSPRDLLIRGAISGALLGAATSFAFVATLSTGQQLAGAMVFPVGFAMIMLLGLELVTGNFALLPLAALEGKAPWGAVVANWYWVFLGNMIGTMGFGALLAITLTNMGATAPTPLAARIIASAELKTLSNEALGNAGVIIVFVKGILCNWLVCLGVVMAMMASSTAGKIVAAWLPIATFVALGFEHSVVNMFVIPTGVLLGAKVTLAQWWLWNQIPVTLGNMVGGFIGLALYATYKPVKKPVPALPVTMRTLAE
ncbi:formate/nitrite transporter family protein [Bradyrhizobium sp.]|uniref:formate/nitrite transporter family protein n=1 Tax=Bradyrhizobium sp. TaxID=376 RepID=UPI003C47D6D0